MQPTTEILERISKDSLTHKEEVFTRLYRYLLRPDIYYQAYQRLYTNKGASTNAAIIYGQSVTPLEKRLKARICELCGTTESERYEIHHINKLKNLKGKEPWEIAMLAKRRKTLVVCEHCHHLIHNQ